VKHAEILMRLEHSSEMKRSQGPRFMIGVSHLKKAGQRLKSCKDYTFCSECYGKRFLELFKASYSSVF